MKIENKYPGTLTHVLSEGGHLTFRQNSSLTRLQYFVSVNAAFFSLLLLPEKTDFQSSEILSHNKDLLEILLEYLKDVETNGKHWKMCFNAKDHSYSASSFHALCNNKGPTVTLVEVGHYVFGGYTDQAWTSGKCHDAARSVVATQTIPKVFLVTDDLIRSPESSEICSSVKGYK